MSRFLDITESGNCEIHIYNQEGCRYKTNNMCFNNRCKWYGKKCHYEETCKNFEKERG